jgi:hypothetical protein
MTALLRFWAGYLPPGLPELWRGLLILIHLGALVGAIWYASVATIENDDDQ